MRSVSGNDVISVNTQSKHGALRRKYTGILANKRNASIELSAKNGWRTKQGYKSIEISSQI